MIERNILLLHNFDWYLRYVLPIILNRAIQQPYGYHGIYTHTSAVVFRGIDYALSLTQNPKPVILACAFHDIARINDGPDTQHAKNAIPIIRAIISDYIPLPGAYAKSVIDAVKNHTTGTVAPDYVSACLWDADRTRLAWECGYNPVFFTTNRAKAVASADAATYLEFMRRNMSEYARNILPTPDKHY